MADESPIILQRHCEVVFQIRGAGVPDEVKSTDLEELTRTAREQLPSAGRLWIDAMMSYTGEAANEEARNQAGKTSRRIATWEVFANDLIFCPAGARKLDPRWYALALAAVQVGEVAA